MRILIAEDDNGFEKLLKRILQKRNYDVLIADKTEDQSVKAKERAVLDDIEPVSSQ
jgi:DNA-binding response OmpR family regulator